MKRALAAVLVIVGAAGVGLTVMAARYVEVLPSGTVIGVVPVGGLTPEEAEKRIRLWWEDARVQTVQLKCPQISAPMGAVRWDSLGAWVDDKASIAQVTPEDFGGSLKRSVGMGVDGRHFPMIFKFDESKLATLKKWVADNEPPHGKAYVTYEKGKVVRHYESNGMEFDQEAFSAELTEAAKALPTELLLPVKTAPKSIPDAEIDKIVEPMATFSTTFSAGNRPRSNNIRIASGKINGAVIMPGQTWSFNDWVGRRTIKAGYQEAGVYVNGRHDTGIGGGICQVSTTLYNSCLLSDLKIVQRSNHSLPVPYVPTGRDATVSFPEPEFTIQNNYDFPIALTSSYVPGKLTFTVLGIKQNLQVEIERGRVSYGGMQVKTVHDPSLPFGKTRIIEPGAGRITVSTWRVVKQDGKVIRRESLGTSVYGGSARIVGKNLKASKPSPKSSAPAGTAPPSAPVDPGSLPESPN